LPTFLFSTDCLSFPALHTLSSSTAAP
jgi:hypothetical protein